MVSMAIAGRYSSGGDSGEIARHNLMMNQQIDDTWPGFSADITPPRGIHTLAWKRFIGDNSNYDAVFKAYYSGSIYRFARILDKFYDAVRFEEQMAAAMTSYNSMASMAPEPAPEPRYNPTKPLTEQFLPEETNQTAATA